MWGALALLAAAASPAEPAVEPHYYWSCKAEIAREGSVLKGDLTIDRQNYIGQLSMEWQAEGQFQFYDWSPKGTMRQRAIWTNREFGQGTIYLTLETEKKLPRWGWIDFGGERNSGTFLTMFGRNPRRYPGASARLSLWALLKWAGEDKALTWSAISESPSRMVAGGVLPMAPYHQLRDDFARMLDDLDAMRGDYQNRCTRGEYEPDYDNMIMV